ncbi:MAG: cyclopropane-fatty-acyl-phospholipid synthase family protein [Gemmatimonadales bacterium]
MKTSDWDERYRAAGYLYGTDPNDFLRDVAGRIPAGPVLAIADGEGRNGVYLATLGHAVTSVDQSAVGLAKARELAAARGVPLDTVVANLADFAIAEEGWSGVVLIFAHLPPALRREVLGKAVRGLVPGGVLILEAYTPAQLGFGTGGPPQAELLMTLEGLRAELAGLDLEIGREIERDIHEGAGHGGRSAVVQIVGVRPGGADRQG